MIFLANRCGVESRLLQMSGDRRSEEGDQPGFCLLKIRDLARGS